MANRFLGTVLIITPSYSQTELPVEALNLRSEGKEERKNYISFEGREELFLSLQQTETNTSSLKAESRFELCFLLTLHKCGHADWWKECWAVKFAWQGTVKIAALSFLSCYWSIALVCNSILNSSELETHLSCASNLYGTKESIVLLSYCTFLFIVCIVWMSILHSGQW